jgi:poly(3-hydroxybutyrate) depolymerase
LSGRREFGSYRDAGYNAVADAKNIIVLYPHAAPWNRLTDPTGLTANPKGCWDWWGFTGDEYLTRDGKQMRAVRAMISRVMR